jgi:hypothetical protein
MLLIEAIQRTRTAALQSDVVPGRRAKSASAISVASKIVGFLHLLLNSARFFSPEITVSISEMVAERHQHAQLPTSSTPGEINGSRSFYFVDLLNDCGDQSTGISVL